MGARVTVTLTDEERETLERWARRPRSSEALALRCRIVLAAADGEHSTDIAERLGCSASTVGKWRGRFATRRLDGLHDELRPGKPRTITDADVERVIVNSRGTAGQRHALVDALDGGGHRAEPDRHQRRDLVRLMIQRVEVLPGRSALRRFDASRIRIELCDVSTTDTSVQRL